MKFAQHLTAQLTPEWRKQYIQYEALKNLLYTIQQGAPAGAELDESLRHRYLLQKDEKFFKLCSEELQKINLFFHQKMAEAQMRLRDLTIQSEQLDKMSSYANLQQQDTMSTTTATSRFRFGRNRIDDDSSAANLSPKTIRELKAAFSEFYLFIILLQNYQQLNATGFQKIVKKHDKVLQTNTGHEWFMDKIVTSDFCTNKEIDSMIEQTEHIVTVQLDHGNRQAAMKRLRVPPLNEKQNAWTTFRFGLFLGSFVILSFLIILTLFFQERPDEPAWVAVRLFRGFIILFANIFLMGVNMYGWQKSGVNHVLIFEIDPRNHLKYQSLMELSSMFAVWWALCLLGYLFGETLGVPATVFPLTLALFCALWLFNPLPILMRSSRFWLIKHCFYCFTAPFHHVTFPDFWLGDQMNSLTTFFLDLQYLICFYSIEVDYGNDMSMYINRNTTIFDATLNESVPMTFETYGINPTTGADVCSSNIYFIRPFISMMPALIRFFQCLRRYRDTRLMFPHLANAGKYSTTIFVVIFGTLNTWYQKISLDLKSPFFYLWVLAYIISFCYTYTWDIKMDWGLLDRNAKENKGLRDELVYGRKWCYFAAMVEDFVFRLAWVLNVSLAGVTSSEVLTCITAPMEVVRRFLWNYFRLENEHVNNCGQFRAVRDISVKPLKKGDFEVVENYMKEPDGVSHREQQYRALLAKVSHRTGGKQHVVKIGKTLIRKFSMANLSSRNSHLHLSQLHRSPSKRSSKIPLVPTRSSISTFNDTEDGF